MKRDKKPTYEKPIIMPLGELAQGMGACTPVGSNPTGPGGGPSQCTEGSVAAIGSCRGGGAPGGGCNPGTTKGNPPPP